MGRNEITRLLCYLVVEARKLGSKIRMKEVGLAQAGKEKSGLSRVLLKLEK